MKNELSRFEKFLSFLSKVQSIYLKMLARRKKRETGRSRMTKKNAPAALQIDVTNDEDWAKILEKEGLIVTDIYSEWSGPCAGMVSILKKLKMEIGGDNLIYVTARCDNISSLERFRGRSEPVWMFTRNGQMVNLMFGANCPEFVKLLTQEFFSIPVSQPSPEEERKYKIYEDAKLAKEEAKRAQREAEVKAKYESEMLHLTSSLKEETCLLVYPWVFKDEEGHRRTKNSSPPYSDLIENVLMDNYTIAQEFRKAVNDDILREMQKESDYEITDQAKELLLDGKCLFMRLKISEKKHEMDVEKYLLSLLFGATELPNLRQWETAEGCYADRHSPAYTPSTKEPWSKFPLAWAPPNPRNKAIVFRAVFRNYVESNYPYEDKSCKAPVIMFKYDTTRKNELKVVMEIYSTEVVKFGIFDCDKPPESKLIAMTIEEFEITSESQTSFETFVCVVKKIGSEAFLAFAGIGPYHVSESPEKAVEESEVYFPNVNPADDAQSDDEEKLDQQTEENEQTENENSAANQ